MRYVRLLNIHCKVHLPKGLEYLPNNLRFLKWKGHPLKYFPPTFYPSKLVELNMCHAQVELLWRGKKGIPNLERLALEGCRNIVEVHPSIGILKKLRLLNLKDCSSLLSLPDFISA
ncbi:hypothetical protein FEM48_Zijuj07G0003600 [Ziziphus jujuba var. spinosa]|uniref:Uncharacterized protein n=1 Tax=Ziziphus jujuba var. spinosa TaxID=714518 RepID=A0A978V1C6_ZIZJJ|nr:hypothetical protein FEM48_Zijuj07G0003600 [Ziziphus jujuba var. spinosa]